ncbi:hypothetical protein MTR_8g469960 [Medicago truncatula]|uniref:Uncharacterized protein n=1 Tax=Medicago truncatula TaxID=3880 RepID=A0A072TR91_MEDTR|nr:hypothetical protein MTR_8g469960 [Medicago truncatula]
MWRDWLMCPHPCDQSPVVGQTPELGIPDVSNVPSIPFNSQNWTHYDVETALSQAISLAKLTIVVF